MDGGLGAPLGGQAADGAVHVLAKAQQGADYTAVQQGAVGVGVGQVGGQQVQLAELVEDAPGGGKLLVAKGAEVEDGEDFGLAVPEVWIASPAGRIRNTRIIPFCCFSSSAVSN